MKAIALLTASALALAACSHKPEPPARQPVSEITVTTDLKAIGNAKAVNYWTNLNTDLKTALANQFVNDISSTGARITVDVDELSLAESYAAGFSQNSTLRGTVTVTDVRGGAIGAGTYHVSSTMAQAEADSNNAAPTSTEFYKALVSSFARGVDQVVNAAPAP